MQRDCVKGRAHCGELSNHIHAVPVSRDHASDAAHLTLDTVKPAQQCGFMRLNDALPRCALRCFIPCVLDCLPKLRRLRTCRVVHDCRLTVVEAHVDAFHPVDGGSTFLTLFVQPEHVIPLICMTVVSISFSRLINVVVRVSSASTAASC
jgi:hypothetical protein